jgi:hypothetical protein
MLKSLIKEYKQNKIFDYLNIQNELSNNLKFIQKDKKIFNINNMLVFKRNKLSESLINTYNLDDKYISDIYHTIDLEDGLNWLYIKEILEYKEKNKKGYKKSESEHILTTNKLSIEILNGENKDFLTGHNLLVKKEIIEIIKYLKLSLVEIPKDYKLFELLMFFRKIKESIDSLKIKYPDLQIRFKKIRKYKKEGMFISKNLIIIDPRNPYVFFHELGHFIFENNLDFNLNYKYYLSKNHIKIVEKNKSSFNLDSYKKLENYDLNSEIFANWFESFYI